MLAAVDGEAAGYLTGAAEDGLTDGRRRQHLVVEHDSERRADIVLRVAAELAGAGLVEAEGDDRLVGARVEAGLRVDQILAGNDRALLQHVAAVRRLDRRVHLVADGHARLLGLFRRNVGMHGMERQLRRLADELLELLGVLQARELHQDAVGALAHDGRFRRAHGVDAPVDGFDGGAGGAGDAVLHALRGGRQRDRISARTFDREVVAAGAEDGVADRLDQLLEGGRRLVEIFRLGDFHLHRVANNTETGEADLAFTQRLARVVAQRVEPILLQFLGVHGEQQMRTAAQVEAQRKLLVRQPTGPAVDRFLREEVRHREEHACKTGQDNGDDLPAFEVQHVDRSRLRFADGRLGAPHVVSFAASPLLRTSISVDFKTRTRMASDRSTSISSEPSVAFVTLPMNSARSDDGVAAAHLVHQLAMRLGARLLRPDDEEIEYEDHRQHGDQQPGERVAAAARHLGIRW